MSKSLWLKVEIEPHATSLDDPGDSYEEVVREVSVTLYELTDDGNDEDTKIVVAELDGIIVRQGYLNEDLDAYDMADAHSGYAEHVCGYLRCADEGDFFDKFEVSSKYGNTLLIQRIAWRRAYTREMMRKFVKRTAEQFDVDLIFIDREESFAKHFENFFRSFKVDGMIGHSAPFLIFSKAYIWPKSKKTKGAKTIELYEPDRSDEPDPEPSITSRGGSA